MEKQELVEYFEEAETSREYAGYYSIPEAIVRGKGDYLLVEKGNQPVPEEEIREYVQDESLRKKPGSDGNADCVHYSRYKLAFREREMEKPMLYWRNQDRI